MPLLEKYNLLLLQPLSTEGGVPALTTILIDTDEEQDSSVEYQIIMSQLDDPQKMGSCITYYRRYALQSLLGLQAEDDDGNKAAEPKSSYKPSIDLSNSVFLKTKWIADKAERDKFNAGIKGVGGKWVPEKKVWAIPADAQKDLPAGTFKGLEAILNAEGEVIPFSVPDEDSVDSLPF